MRKLSFLENNSIGFVKVFENRLGPQVCESGTATLTRIVNDPIHNGIIYALTEHNDVIVFEQKQQGNKQETIECRGNNYFSIFNLCLVIGVLNLQQNFQADQKLAFAALKGSLIF